MSINSITLFDTALWLSITVIAYAISLFVYKRSAAHPMFHPLLGTAIIVTAALLLFDVSLEEYRRFTWLISFLLGPATVALAIPLYKQIKVLVRLGYRVVLPICIGGTIAPLLAWLSIYFFDTPLNLQMTMLVKSITTPLAMGTAESIGGIASLAAVLVIITGIVGAIFAPMVFKLAKVESHMAQGIALGTVAHAVGTSRAISTSEVCAAFATLAVCLNGIITASILPVLFA